MLEGEGDLKEEEPQSRTRRGVLWLGLAGIGALILGPLVQTVRFLRPNVLFEPPLRFKVGEPERYGVGTITYVPPRRVFIVRTEQGFHCISANCTHLGCIVTATENGFNCPCHGSKFDKKGNKVSGPAPRPLEWFEITLAEDGKLLVDTTKKVGQDYLLPV